MIHEVSYVTFLEENNGICLNCGTMKYGGVEPDARGYFCENCEKNCVYGLQEALMMNEIILCEAPK